MHRKLPQCPLTCPNAEGGVIGCKRFSWLRGVGCGLSSAFERVGPGCDRCGAGVWVVPGAHRQNARPVPVGDQGRDQAQRGRRRVLQGRGGGAHGRTSARPSQGARPRCRPCPAVPCRVRPRPGPNAPPDQRAPQGPERVAGVGRHVLAPQQSMGARSATRRLCTWIHTPSWRRGLVGARDRAAPGGGTRKSAPSPATNPTRAPSPTNRATAPAPPSTTPPHKRHSPNSLSPSLDTTHSQPQPRPRRTVASACAVEPTASEAPAPCPPRGRDGAGAQRLERSVRAVRPRCQQSSGQTHGHAARPARRRGSRDQWTAPVAACLVVGGLAHLEADTRTLRVADTSGCRLTFTV